MPKYLYVKLHTFLKQFGVPLVPTPENDVLQQERNERKYIPYIRSWSLDKRDKVLLMLLTSGDIR